MLSLPSVLLAICLLPRPQPARAQGPEAWYAGAISGGRAFMMDADDPDPPGSYSLAASIEQRRIGRSLSVGIETGLHRYLVIDQHLSDVTGFENRLQDKRQTWRLTPYLRWRTGGNVSLHAQVGAGIYLRRMSYLQQEREAGALRLDTSFTRTTVQPGLNLRVGMELFPPGSSLGLGLGLGGHAVRGGDGFNTAEIGIVWRARWRAPAR